MNGGRQIVLTAPFTEMIDSCGLLHPDGHGLYPHDATSTAGERELATA